MKHLMRYLLVLGLLAIPMSVLAAGKYTKIGKLQIYSEYYPNPDAKFKGTILFENGSGGTLREWTRNRSFFQCAKTYGSLFLYDRSGLGKSPPDFEMSSNNPLTAALINDKLMQLLKKRNIKPPYILVAHSYGGLYSGYFARKFPKLIKGILMVDPVPNNYEWADDYLREHQLSIEKLSKLSSREVYRQYKTAIAQKQKVMTRPELLYQLLGFEQAKKQVNELAPLSNQFPIIILSSSYMEKHAPVKGDWYKEQQQWLNTNPNSKIIKAHSGHWIQVDRPRLVCKQLRTIVNLAVGRKK